MKKQSDIEHLQITKENGNYKESILLHITLFFTKIRLRFKKKRKLEDY